MLKSLDSRVSESRGKNLHQQSIPFARPSLESTATPNFLVIGAAKSGTTTLASLMNQHPDVFIPTQRELYFFASDDNYREMGWDGYLEYFRGASRYEAIGEVDPDYSMAIRFPRCASRIVYHIPDVRIIYLVRHPLQRIESHWRQLRFNGENPPSFAQSLRQRRDLIDASLYMKQLNEYRRYLSDDRILVLWMNELIDSPQEVARRVFRFLGLDPRVQVRPSVPKLNSYHDNRVDRAILRSLRRVPGFDRLYGTVRDCSPGAVRSFVKRAFRKPMPRGTWTPALINEVIDQIADDNAEFLSFTGKQRDFWDLNAV